MAASAAIAAFGTLLSIGDGASPEVFTALAEIVAVKAPSVSVTPIKTTHQTSPAGVEEYIPGLQDNGDIVARLNWIPSVTALAAAVVIRGLYRTKKNWRITYPNAKTDTMAVVFSGFEPDDAPTDGKLGGMVKGKVSGPITAA